MPSLVTPDRADAGLRRAAQLATLGQDLPVDESVRPRGQSAGVREKEVERPGDWEIRSRFSERWLPKVIDWLPISFEFDCHE